MVLAFSDPSPTEALVLGRNFTALLFKYASKAAAEPRSKLKVGY